MQMKKINLKEKFGLVSEFWDPKIVGELNGQYVKLVKFKNEFVWHSHEQEDELFFVVKGAFKMELRNETIEVKEGEMIIIPRGVEHRPVAENEVWVMLFEPASTLNTGNVVNERTKRELGRI
jgi:mannose-6-phosphate isomerase-like protein (cupin superfamily)